MSSRLFNAVRKFFSPTLKRRRRYPSLCSSVEGLEQRGLLSASATNMFSPILDHTPPVAAHVSSEPSTEQFAVRHAESLASATRRTTNPAAAPKAAVIDLTPSIVDAPPRATSGAIISVDTRIDNKGTSPSGRFSVAYYASLDTSITKSDVFLKKVSVESINGSGAKRWSQSLSLPASLAPGKYYIGVIADIDNEVKETNESNNALADRDTISIQITSRISGNSVRGGESPRGLVFPLTIAGDTTRLLVSNGASDKVSLSNAGWVDWDRDRVSFSLTTDPGFTGKARLVVYTSLQMWGVIDLTVTNGKIKIDEKLKLASEAPKTVSEPLKPPTELGFVPTFKMKWTVR